MLKEFATRVITEVERTTAWPSIGQVKVAMDKIAADMEAEAVAAAAAEAVKVVDESVDALKPAADEPTEVEPNPVVEAQAENEPPPAIEPAATQTTTE